MKGACIAGLCCVVDWGRLYMTTTILKFFPNFKDLGKYVTSVDHDNFRIQDLRVEDCCKMIQLLTQLRYLPRFPFRKVGDWVLMTDFSPISPPAIVFSTSMR